MYLRAVRTYKSAVMYSCISEQSKLTSQWLCTHVSQSIQNLHDSSHVLMYLRAVRTYKSVVIYLFRYTYKLTTIDKVSVFIQFVSQHSGCHFPGSHKTTTTKTRTRKLPTDPNKQINTRDSQRHTVTSQGTPTRQECRKTKVIAHHVVMNVTTMSLDIMDVTKLMSLDIVNVTN